MKKHKHRSLADEIIATQQAKKYRVINKRLRAKADKREYLK